MPQLRLPAHAASASLRLAAMPAVSTPSESRQRSVVAPYRLVKISASAGLRNASCNPHSNADDGTSSRLVTTGAYPRIIGTSNVSWTACMGANGQYVVLIGLVMTAVGC